LQEEEELNWDMGERLEEQEEEELNWGMGERLEEEEEEELGHGREIGRRRRTTWTGTF